MISPAKKQRFDSAVSHVKTSCPMFQKEVMQLVRMLQKYSPQQLSKLMGISEKLAELNVERFQSFDAEPNLDTLQCAAIFAYQGDTYKGLQAESFSSKNLAYAQQHLLILSGLYGVLRPLDCMQPYRLEMGTRGFMQSDLYTFWGETVVGYLKTQQVRQIVNLASDEYAQLLKRVPSAGFEIVDVTFLQDKSGELKNIGLHSKKARGQMAAFMVKNEISQIASLKAFDAAGYQYQSSLSNAHQLVFVREG